MIDVFHSTREINKQNKFTEKELLDIYKKDFYSHTGKSLTVFILKMERERQKELRTNSAIPLQQMLDIVNKEIPGYLKAEYPCISTTGRKGDIPKLREVFTAIALMMNYNRTEVKKILNVHHSSVIHYIKSMNSVLEIPQSNPDLHTMYHNILDKIQTANAKHIQSNIVKQPNTQSNVSTLLDP